MPIAAFPPRTSQCCGLARTTLPGAPQPHAPLHDGQPGGHAAGLLLQPGEGEGRLGLVVQRRPLNVGTAPQSGLGDAGVAIGLG